MKKSDKVFAFTLILLFCISLCAVLIYVGKSYSPSVISTYLPVNSANEPTVHSSAPVSPSISESIPSSFPSKESNVEKSRSSSASASQKSSKPSGIFIPESSDQSAEPMVRININSATVEELEGFPRINHLRAMIIVDYRERNGPFESLSEILELDGMGDLSLELLSEYFTV